MVQALEMEFNYDVSEKPNDTNHVLDFVCYLAMKQLAELKKINH
jgi:hypothetical protein